jgi:hypothetical protein
MHQLFSHAWKKREKRRNICWEWKQHALEKRGIYHNYSWELGIINERCLIIPNNLKMGVSLIIPNVCSSIVPYG